MYLTAMCVINVFLFFVKKIKKNRQLRQPEKVFFFDGITIE